MSWNEVVRMHGPAAYRTAWRILGHIEDTEDVLQDVLLEAHVRFEAGDVRHWRAFLNRLATFRALDRLRRRKNTVALDEVLIYDGHAGPEAEVAGREAEERLRTVIAELPERQAAVFCLFYFESLSHGEIADTLDITTNAVTVALYKTRATLKVAMLEAEQEHDR